MRNEEENAALVDTNEQNTVVSTQSVPKKKKTTTKQEKCREWLHREIILLIELWGNESCLYNVKDPNYHKKDCRSNAIGRIKDMLAIDTFHISDEDITAKLHSLRVYYSTLRNKREKSKSSGAGADQVYVVKWVYFEMLSFLNDNLQPRKTISNLNAAVPSTHPSTDEDVNNVQPTPSHAKNLSKKIAQKEGEDDVAFKRYATSFMKKITEPKGTKELTADDHFCEMINKKLHDIPHGPRKEFLKLEIHRMIISEEFSQSATSSPMGVSNNAFNFSSPPLTPMAPFSAMISQNQVPNQNTWNHN